MEIENVSDTNQINEDSLCRIRSMYLSENVEDKDIAYKWLVQLIGLRNANANLFILTFYKDWESDKGEIIDQDNFWDLKFKTCPISCTGWIKFNFLIANTAIIKSI